MHTTGQDLAASATDAGDSLPRRTHRLFTHQLWDVRKRVDGLFAWMMVGQWCVSLLVALALSHYGGTGSTDAGQAHVPVMLVAGGIIGAVPLLLVRWRPGAAVTRHAMAVSQMLWSALFIQLTDGRFETHFHIFASLAFLSLYRDQWVLLSASVTITVDHFLRGLWWPESLYGLASVEWWRFLEHAFWVVVTDAVLIAASLNVRHETWQAAERRAEAELAHERKLKDQARALHRAEEQLREFQDQLARMQKLATVGQMAASISHELRNPLAAARAAVACILQRVANLQDALGGSRILHFLDVTERELAVCAKIISDVLDFARERPPELAPCPVRPLVDEVLRVVPGRAGVRVHNGVSESLPVPRLDRELFRLVLVNLVQNAVEAVPPGKEGHVRVEAEGGRGAPWRIRVVDDGKGIPAEMLPRIFEPLFTTKTQGTGLGLAIVSALIHKHGGTLSVYSQVGLGTEFLIELPAESLAKSA